MAALDIYRSLSEEQKSRLRSCSTPAQIKAFIEDENIVLTPDQIEAFSGNLVLGRRIKREGMIETGLYGKFILPSEEWHELVLEARRNEQSIRLKFPHAGDYALRLIAESCPGLDEALQESENEEAFIEACLNLRGPFREGRIRRTAREKARLIRYLNGINTPVSSREDILKLWETAMESEPRWKDDLPPHFRTPHEGIPFSHGRSSFEPGPVPRGSDTTPSEKIPEAVDCLVKWMKRQDLQPELQSAAAFLMFIRIHPFPDGNGHAARLLSCSMLASGYSVLTLASWIDIQHEYKSVVKEAAMLTELSSGDICTPCCMLLRMLVRGQRRILS